MTTTHSRPASGNETRSELPVRTWDGDAFAGIDESEGYLPGDVIHDMHAEQEPVFRSEREADAVLGILTGLADIEQPAEEPAFPTADPEPSMSLQQFQQRVANGEWNAQAVAAAVATGATPDQVVEAAHGLLTAAEVDTALEAVEAYGDNFAHNLGLTDFGRRVHNGRITYRTKANRRARNRASRAARRINRGH